MSKYKRETLKKGISERCIVVKICLKWRETHRCNAVLTNSGRDKRRNNFGQTRRNGSAQSSNGIYMTFCLEPNLPKNFCNYAVRWMFFHVEKELAQMSAQYSNTYVQNAAN